jgi:uncharacterized damage-inducible protein DinB
VEQLEIIEALKKLPEHLELADVSDAPRRYRPAEGEWSINETVGHLRDMVEVWHMRLYQVWSQNDPLFTSFDGEASVIAKDYQNADMRKLTEEIAAQRIKTVDLLTDAVDWTRLGQQRGVGRRTLKQFAEFVLSHDEDHLNQIRALKAAAIEPASRA